MRRFFTDYITGHLMLALMPIRWPKWDGNAKGSIGMIDFVGPTNFVVECLKAINDYLPKYDMPLKQELLNGNISLHFYCEEGKYSFKYYSIALFAIPEHITRYKSEGICQFVIFRYFQVLELGKGPYVALNYNLKDYDAAMFKVKRRMIDWLLKCRYPERWIDCYKWHS